MKRYPLVSFFVLAFLISWTVGVPLALQRAGVLRTALPYSLHYLTAYGPIGPGRLAALGPDQRPR